MENPKEIAALELADLILRNLDGKLSHQEQHKLNAWIAQSEANKQRYNELANTTNWRTLTAGLEKYNADKAYQKLQQLHTTPQTLKPTSTYYRYAVAIFAALVAIGVYFFALKQEQQQIYSGQRLFHVAKTIAPGSDKATLTLPNGKTINLGTVAAGTILKEEGLTITKAADGSISYTASNDPTTLRGKHTLQTPKGGQYQVRLPDGTKVLLNAASTLRYDKDLAQAPTRSVELNGEAYFEVAHSEWQPFIVKTALQEVTVLGTHFNINSYTDEPKTITTLVQGAVRVSSLLGKKQSYTLTPGQQSLLANGNMKVQQADIEQALAWKNNEILFKSASIEEIMRQTARWYNIDVAYEGAPPTEPITGGISRHDNLDVLLRVLQLSGLQYNMEKTGNSYKLIIKTTN